LIAASLFGRMAPRSNAERTGKNFRRQVGGADLPRAALGRYASRNF
jgi:hypothetical protein